MGCLNALWIFPGEATPGDESWLLYYKIKPPNAPNRVFELFVIGAHFVVTTITTVGFGDIAPKDVWEYFLVMGFQVSYESILIQYGNRELYLYN